MTKLSLIMDSFCRFDANILPEQVFRLVACSYCYFYLFDTTKEDFSFYLKQRNPTMLFAKNGTMYSEGTAFISDITNTTIISNVCRTLSDRNCQKWTTCCREANQCCKRQLSMPNPPPNSTYCPRMWDGWGCLDDTRGSTTAFITCPDYVDHSGPNSKAYRECWSNGTWFIHPETGRGWSNYSTCVDIKNQVMLAYIGLACNILSLLLLIPSCAIFLWFRPLRQQQRIRLHLCFFASFILTTIVTIMWDFLIHQEKLVNGGKNGESRIEANSGGCKFLYILMRYSQAANYFWMFCEGFYLHRLIVHAFEVPKNLLWYYIIGFGASWVPIIVYVIIRLTKPEFDNRCWVSNMFGFEWLVYTPNLLCLFANLFFLVNILRILLTQLQSHPNEPSGYRRALKATFVLMPLFGIQWALVIYRPDNTVWFEPLRVVIQNTQGGIVSLIFCIFNGEVHTHLKNFFHRHWPSSSPGRGRPDYSTVSATQYTHINSRSSTAQDFNQEGIPLGAHDAHVVKDTNGHAKETGSLLL